MTTRAASSSAACYAGVVSVDGPEWPKLIFAFAAAALAENCPSPPWSIAKTYKYVILASSQFVNTCMLLVASLLHDGLFHLSLRCKKPTSPN